MDCPPPITRTIIQLQPTRKWGSFCTPANSYTSGRTEHWIKVQNPKPAVKRDAEEERASTNHHGSPLSTSTAGRGDFRELQCERHNGLGACLSVFRRRARPTHDHGAAHSRRSAARGQHRQVGRLLIFSAAARLLPFNLSPNGLSDAARSDRIECKLVPAASDISLARQGPCRVRPKCHSGPGLLPC
jgi:hypothetical protein